MKARPLGLDGVVEIDYEVHRDNRGWFMETFDIDEFERLDLPVHWPHDSLSFSESAATIRGLHYQAPPFGQAKIVSVASGEIYDVVVDIRQGSDTYLLHLATQLSPGRAVYVPEGFAHGFCTLVAHTFVVYKMNQVYSPHHARGIRWDDPALGINWPVSSPVMSERDRDHPTAVEATEFGPDDA